jgi:hypothetical protein
MFSSVTNALHVRNGGLIGLAGTAIALGVDIAPYMERFLEPLLVCFSDPENRVRYFAAECLYNIAKVSKGEVLVYFNPIFDALSKVSRIIFSDTPPSLALSSLQTQSNLSRMAQNSLIACSKTSLQSPPPTMFLISLRWKSDIPVTMELSSHILMTMAQAQCRTAHSPFLALSRSFPTAFM